jgi:magnesium transporter
VSEVLEGLDAVARQRVASLRAEGRFFWVDVSLRDTSHSEVREALRLPEGAVRAVRASTAASASRTVHADDESVVFAFCCYVDAEASIVAQGYHLQPLWVHVVVTPDYLLTLHEERLALPTALAATLPEEQSGQSVLYSALDAMLDSTFDALEEVELTLDTLAQAGIEGDDRSVPTANLRRDAVRLATMQRWVTAEQALLDRLSVKTEALRGFRPDDERYFERLAQHASALLVSIEAAANGMGILLDVQLNHRAYLVSVVATIFVPLTFITGFFGMNFEWMIARVDTGVAFWWLGVAVPILAVLLSWRLLLRQFLPRVHASPGGSASARNTRSRRY